MTDKSYDPMEQLSAALGRVCTNTRVERLAALAYLQASLAQAATQGLINLIMTKNILSREEIERAMNAAYDERYKQLAGTHTAEMLPAPTTRKN